MKFLFLFWMMALTFWTAWVYLDTRRMDRDLVTHYKYLCRCSLTEGRDE